MIKRLLSPLACLLPLFAAVTSTPAATIIKADNANDLNQPSSWVSAGPPGTNDVGAWDSTVSGPNTTLLGADMSWAGLAVGLGASNPGGHVIINGINTLTLGTNGISLSSANRNLTLNCNVTLAADQTWSAGTAAARTIAVSTTIAGNHRLTKDGVGTLTLTGANTYTGGTVVAGGTLSIDADESLGTPSSPLFFAATNTLTLTAAGTYGAARAAAITNGATTTFSTTIIATWAGPIDGPGALAKAGSGTLILTATNTYSGPTTITAGNLRARDGAGLPAAGNLTIAGGVWESDAAIARTLGTAPGELQLGAGSSGFSAFGAPVTVSLNGGAALTWGTNSFTPTTALVLNSANADNTLTVANPIEFNSAATRPIAVNGNTAVLAGTLSNTLAGGLTKSGNGRLVLAGTNTFTGPTAITAGALQAADTIGLPAGNLAISATGIFEPLETFSRANGTNAGQFQLAGTVSGFSARSTNATLAIPGTLTWGSATFNPATLVLNTADATADLTLQAALDLNGGGRVIQVNTNSATIAGPITHSAGSSRIHKTGAGTLILSGTNSWSHTQSFGTNLYITAGTVQVAQEENLGGTAASFQARGLMLDGGALRTTASFDINDPNRGLFLGGNSGRFHTDAGTTLTINNPISGPTGILHKDGPGTLVLTATNTWGAGGNYLQLHEGTLVIDSDLNLGASIVDLYIDGVSALHVSATTTLNSGRAIVLNTNWTVSVTNNATLTIDGVANESAGASGTLIKAGAGTLILSAAHNYNGATVVAEGTLRLPAGERLQNATPLRVSGGTFDLQGFNETVAAFTLAGGSVTSTVGSLIGTVYNVESGTINAGLAGTAAMVKSTSGTVTINTTNAFTGGTTINGGTLLVNTPAGSATGPGAIVVNATGTLGGIGTVGGATTLNANGALAPGVSVGTLTLPTLNWNVGALGIFEFAPGGSNDQVIVATPGGFTLNGGLVTAFEAGSTNALATPGIYQLIQYTAPLQGAGPASLAIANPLPGLEYNFAALNGWIVLIVSTLGAPDVTNASGASGIATHAAQLNGFLVATGGTPTSVSIYWGTTDGGTNPAAWARTNALGPRSTGAFSVNTAPHWLNAQQTHYYRAFASNANGSDWADSSASFVTLAEPGSTESPIDAALLNVTAEFGPSPDTVFVDYSVGYLFFVATGGNVTYRKTLDGGATWGSPVSLGDDQDDGTVAVWYDRWTPGSTGTRIHIAHVGSTGDDLMYNALDTATDTAGPWRPIVNATTWSSASRANAPAAITKTSDGRLLASFGATLGLATNFVCWSWDGISWLTNSPTDQIADNDFGQLLPLPDGDALLIQQDASLNLFRSAVLASNGTWTAWATNIGASVDDTTYLSHFAATLNPLNGDVFLAGHTDPATAAGDLRAWHFNASNRTWTAAGTIVDDAAMQISSVTLLADASNGELYAVYARRDVGAITTAVCTNMYLQVRHSADNGRTWSGETTISSLPGQDIRIVRGNLLNTERLYAVWFENNMDDAFGNTVADLVPTRLRIAATGVADITAHTATLHGRVNAEGPSPAAVWIYWGTTNAGTSRSAWLHGQFLGTPGTGDFAFGAAPLMHYTNYFYRLYATNLQGETWSDTTPAFSTPADANLLRGTNFVGSNLDFENPADSLSALPGWRGDGGQYVTVGTDGIVTPHHGTFMFQTGASDGTDPCGGVNNDSYQEIPLDLYTVAITNGDVTFEFELHYNRIAGPTVDSQFFFNVAFYNAAGQSLGWFGVDPVFGTALIADDNPATWQSGLVSGLVPANAVEARIRVSWGENVQNDCANEFPGNYTDNIQLRIVVPGTPPPPTGIIVIVK